MTAGRTTVTKRRDWGTPRVYVDAVRRFFGDSICLDPCAGPHSIVGAETEFALPGQDGLALEWDYPRIYVNPPYGIDRERGTTIADWLKKCAEARERHRSEVLALVPVATNTSHWKRHVFGSADAVCFLADTRLRFLVDGREGGKGAPMACAMVCWSGRYRRFLGVFGRHGAVVDIRHLRWRGAGGGRDPHVWASHAASLSWPPRRARTRRPAPARGHGSGQAVGRARQG